MTNTNGMNPKKLSTQPAIATPNAHDSFNPGIPKMPSSNTSSHSISVTIMHMHANIEHGTVHIANVKDGARLTIAIILQIIPRPHNTQAAMLKPRIASMRRKLEGSKNGASPRTASKIAG
jgi:hypothetical protein